MLAGEARPWPVGVLYRRAADLGQLVLEELRPRRAGRGRRQPAVRIQLDGTDYTVPVHGDDRGVPSIAFEVRHDEIDDDPGVAVWCDRLGTALERTLARVGDAPSAAAR